MKNINKICLFFIILSFCFIANLEAANARIGKINVALLAALHPKMSLFDFRAMGFYRVELGTTQEERNAILKNYKENKELKEKVKQEFSNIDGKIYRLNKELIELERLKDEKQDEESNKVFNKINSIKEKIKEYKRDWNEKLYEYNYPQFTSPNETRDILRIIEKETLEAINEVYKEGNYDVILNTYVPAPYGYPLTYSKMADFYKGPLWITQSVYFSIICGNYLSKNEYYEDFAKIVDWVKRLCRPETEKYLPMSPRPVVLKGGEDIMVKCLAKLYKKYNLNEDTLKVMTEFFEKNNQEE